MSNQINKSYNLVISNIESQVKSKFFQVLFSPSDWMYTDRINPFIAKFPGFKIDAETFN